MDPALLRPAGPRAKKGCTERVDARSVGACREARRNPVPRKHRDGRPREANVDASRFDKVKTVLRVTSGNFLEMYDFFLFGIYARQIGLTFFPNDDPYASLMLTFLSFAAGFAMRPIGALVLGPYIDRIGRRKGLIVTLSIMACGTILIAFVPSYATIGVLAR